jgi:4-aminobutyrate aminotransferase-like enzyme
MVKLTSTWVLASLLTAVGHCHPKVVAAAKAQLDQLMHTSVTTHHSATLSFAKSW